MQTMAQLATDNNFSSFHCLFPKAEQLDWLSKLNLNGSHTATEQDWQDLAYFYKITFEEKWSTPTLNKGFFQEVAENLPDQVFLVLADLPTGECIAGSLMFRSETKLYGRHWGCTHQVDKLHFEACYYQGIEYCIRNGLQVFEPGAQGEHKMARGFIPTETRSAHWLNNSPYQDSIAQYVDHECKAVYFAKAFPQATWQCSDQQQYHAGIQLWLDEAQLPNLIPPISLNVSKDPWPTEKFDVLYSANVMHIMHWQNVIDLFKQGANCLKPGGLMVCYGPFNFAGQYTSPSNAQFDQSLRMRDPESGIRNFEDLQKLADEAELNFVSNYEMPANNRILVWQK